MFRGHRNWRRDGTTSVKYRALRATAQNWREELYSHIKSTIANKIAASRSEIDSVHFPYLYNWEELITCWLIVIEANMLRQYVAVSCIMHEEAALNTNSLIRSRNPVCLVTMALRRGSNEVNLKRSFEEIPFLICCFPSNVQSLTKSNYVSYLILFFFFLTYWMISREAVYAMIWTINLIIVSSNTVREESLVCGGDN